MKEQNKIYKAIYPRVDSRDRFIALQEAKSLLDSRNVDLTSLFKALFQADNGELRFDIGALSIEFLRGCGVWSERKDVVQLTLKLRKEDYGEVVSYEYTLDDLSKLEPND